MGDDVLVACERVDEGKDATKDLREETHGQIIDDCAGRMLN